MLSLLLLLPLAQVPLTGMTGGGPSPVCTAEEMLTSRDVGAYCALPAFAADAGRAISLTSDGTDCAAGTWPTGVDALGNATGCTSPPGASAGGLGRTYFFAPDAGEILGDGGWRTAALLPSPAPEATATVTVSGTGDFPIATFVTPAVNATSLAAGVATRHFHSHVSLTTATARWRLDLSRYNAADAGRDLLRTGYSNPWSNTTSTEIEWGFTDSNGYAFETADRIIFDVYAARVSGPASFDVTLTYAGDAGRVSYVQTTIQEPAVVPAYAYDAGIADRLRTAPAGCDGGMFPVSQDVFGTFACIYPLQERCPVGQFMVGVDAGRIECAAP